MVLCCTLFSEIRELSPLVVGGHGPGVVTGRTGTQTESQG